MAAPSDKPHVVIVGGGFGGLYTARALGNKPVRVTLIDRRNFHLFQPLLYQIATGALSAGDIASPLRSVLRNCRNIEVLMDEMVDLDPERREIKLKFETQPVHYDMLVLATGSVTHYFGHPDWPKTATGLKTVEDAITVRRQIFNAFEAAERERDPAKQKELMTFVLVGAGPTGVEMAGAMAELASYSLPREFRHIRPQQAQIILIDAAPRVLGTYPEDLSRDAARTLTKMGVIIRTGAMVNDIQPNRITFSTDGQSETITAGTILWSAGVKASPLGQLLADRTGCELDKGGRVRVNPDCSLPNHPEVFVIGDLSCFCATPNQKPLPGVAAVAIQQGEYLGRLLCARLQTGTAQSIGPFRYQDKGNLAVIGLNEAVAAIGKFHLQGFFAWLIWAIVHIRYLIGFDNKLLVMFQWFWTYLTRKHSARLITGPQAYD